MVDFLPPAPNAASIVKYGGLTINKNTGAPNINIPIIGLSSKRLSTQISLGYSSTGIKVDEVASRVGMGWTILSGGVITRTVRGTPDGTNPRLVPWATPGTNWATYNFMNKIASSNNAAGYDAEPDLFNFNFNGYAGSFVFDEGMNIVPVTPNNFKYSYNFSGTGWNFKVTTSDGVNYYFGGTGATEKTKRDQVCGKLFDTYIATSWYLIKIEHPNGDIISFSYLPLEYTYDNGVTETMYWTLAQPPDGGGPLGDCASVICSNPINTSCINLTRTQGVLLDEITANDNQKLKFEYVSRGDCLDKLISRITLSDIRQGSNTAIKVWNLNYTEVTASNYQGRSASGNTKTPYLTELIERSPDSTLLTKYSFQYNDPSARPPRLSYAQDHWGYFNGRSNSTLIPIPTDPQLRQEFPTATANRDLNSPYALKGMLSKIYYPTGGMDSIVYESNDAYGSFPGGNQYTLFSKVTGTGNWTTVTKTSTFAISSLSNSNRISFTVNCIDNSGTGNYDPVHNLGAFDIRNPAGTVIYSRTAINPGQTIIDSVVISSTGVYTLNVKANGTVITTKATLTYIPSGGGGMDNVLTGGLRVKAVVTAANQYERPIVKRYYYGSINSLTQSSMIIQTDPLYNKAYDTRMICMGTPGLPIYSYLFCHHNALYSNSLVSLLDYQSSVVSYASVVESNGDSLEAGGIETKFYAASDAAGQVLLGQPMLNAPKSNSISLLNGKVKEETVYKQSSLKSLIPQKKTTTTYKLDSRKTKLVYGYAINQKYENSVLGDSTCNPLTDPVCNQVLIYCIDAFDMIRYDILSKWIYADSSTEITYDETGNNPMTKLSLFYYDDSTHLQLTKTRTYDSKGNIDSTVIKYPRDFSGTAVYDSMVARNIISSAVDIQKFIGGSKTQEFKTNYSNWSNGNFSPASVQKGILSNVLENQGQITKYDRNGNILEFKGVDGVITSVIYAYNNLYPVAKIVGAGYDVAKSQLSVDTSVIQTYSDAQLLTELNRIRTNLTNAQVTTYTYKHLVGVTSITDINNRISYYDYDLLGRLKTIRDFNNNYLKKIDYVYTQPDLTQKVKVFFNPTMTQTFLCQTCSTGFVPVGLTYIVPAGKYFSTISQTDANNKAQAEINLNGQTRANNSGGCSMTCESCYGEGLKCINEVCELGTKIVTSTVQQGNNWVCIYHYHWSDGTNSQDYTITSSTYCGLD